MSKKILCCFVLIVLMLTSCSTFSEKGMLAATGSYAVPGMSVGNIKGTEVVCNILDEDQYGRLIYEFEARNVITQKREKVPRRETFLKKLYILTLPLEVTLYCRVDSSAHLFDLVIVLLAIFQRGG